MSDSTKPEELFNSREFARELCKNQEISFATAHCSFRQGWAKIFEKFIARVGKYPVYISLVSDDHQFLEIEVAMDRTTRARYIYEQILVAKYDSRQVCAHCGGKKTESGDKFCIECISNAAKLKTTGTWLDSFERIRRG